MKMESAVDSKLMRCKNRKLVFQKIYQKPMISRANLAQSTGLSVMSAGRLADELLALGLVAEANPAGEAALGRRPKHLQIDKENLKNIAVTLDRNGFTMGVVDPYGEVTKSLRRNLNVHTCPLDEFSDQLVLELKKLLPSVFRESVVPAIGITVPGIVDFDSGNVRLSSQLGWRNFALKQELQARLNESAVVVVENDTKALALAESRLGSGKDLENFVVLNIGSGIGAAAVIDHVVYRGKNNIAGEIGHIPITPNGRLCECGKIGCLQTHIADWAILRDARSIEPNITVDGIFEACRCNVPWAVNLIQQVTQYIVIAISMLANLLSPEAVILCGSLVDDYPLLREQVRVGYESRLSGYLSDTFRLEFSSFKSTGTLIGAGMIAVQEHINHLLSEN